MKKWLKITLLVVVVVVIVAVSLLAVALDGAVKTAVVTVLPQITGTDVKLDKVSISMLSGKGELSGFIIGNPEGYKTKDAFELGKVRVDVDLASLLSDTIVIQEIYIDAPNITYEAGFPSNIGKIQENVEEFSGPKEEKPEEEPEEKPAKPGKKIQINHFLLENGTISLSAKILGGQTATVPLPKIEMHDIGKETDGASVAEVAEEVFSEVTGSVTEVATEALKMGKELLNKGVGAVTEGAADAIEGGKEAIGEGADAVKEGAEGAVEEGKKAVEDAVGGVKDLFK